MASKKQTIVIKKIIVQGGGHHGGSWKVALADFMTAMMAFFLVMWLIGQDDQTKKAISDYFSTPSMIEYNYQNYGAEITLEKLFLDFMNEPMKAVQSFFEPADRTPNVLDMGSTKVMTAFTLDKMTDIAKNVTISKDLIEFDIPESYLFEYGTAAPKADFVKVMDKLVGVTSGLKDGEVKLVSSLFIQSVADQSSTTAEKIAQARLDLVRNKLLATFEQASNTVNGSLNITDKKGEVNPDKLLGFIRVQIASKKNNNEVKMKTNPTSNVSTSSESVVSKQPVFDDFVKEALKEDAGSRKPAEGSDPNLVNPADAEVYKLDRGAAPTSN